MTSNSAGEEPGSRPSAVAAARVRQLRAERGMTASRLAGRCAELGAPAITTNVIANIETRGRAVTVDELLVFALALDVPPVHLLTPAPSGQGTSSPAVAITGSVRAGNPATLHRWLRGAQALPGTRGDVYAAAAREYDTGLPSVPADTANRIAAQFEQQAAAFVAQVRGDVDQLLAEVSDSVAGAVSPQDVQATIEHARARITAT